MPGAYRKRGESIPSLLGVIGEEYQEVVQAVEKETPDRVYQELLDLITTSIRAANGEHEVGHGPADV